MTESTRELRLSSMSRGIAIGVIGLVYAYVARQPGASLTVSLLIGAGLQVAVLLLRRFVPPDQLPRTLAVFELAADAVTVFLFALGVYGGMVRVAYDV